MMETNGPVSRPRAAPSRSGSATPCRRHDTGRPKPLRRPLGIPVFFKVHSITGNRGQTGRFPVVVGAWYAFQLPMFKLRRKETFHLSPSAPSGEIMAGSLVAR